MAGPQLPQHRVLALLDEDALFVGDVEGRLHDVNPAACALTGYRRSELLRMSATELVAPEWLDFSVRQRRRKIESSEDVTSYECVFLAKDGARVPVQVTSTLVKDGDAVTGVQALVRDLRRQVAADRRLAESEERFRRAFEGAAIGMAMVAPDGRWLRVNDSLTRLLGYTSDELLDLTFQDITHPDDLQRDLEAARDVLAGRVSWYHIEKRYIRKDGTIVWGLLAVSLVRDAAGSPAYFISQISDITATKTAELARRDVLSGLPSEPRPLSAREVDVVRCAADGKTTAETARALGIAEETVQTLVKRASRKLGARNRTHLVAVALRLGLLPAALGAERP
jgi:PAS domain S-box-containing protein